MHTAAAFALEETFVHAPVRPILFHADRYSKGGISKHGHPLSPIRIYLQVPFAWISLLPGPNVESASLGHSIW